MAKLRLDLDAEAGALAAAPIFTCHVTLTGMSPF